jgi:hypothetical protein
MIIRAPNPTATLLPRLMELKLIDFMRRREFERSEPAPNEGDTVESYRLEG